ncbi:MAG: NAD(P)H-hydrate epimerase [Planctomyces sp.]|nr:NAD(P)H-hydrate epimerase [Planctomyces sp.]
MTSELYLSRKEVRAVDQAAMEQYHLPGIVLMENAGLNAVRYIEKLGDFQKIVVCAGKGNNGGDGFVIARHLQFLGREVHILLFADPEKLSGDARTNYEICRAGELPLTIHATADPEELDLKSITTELTSADLVIDALLGTGTRGEVREPYATLIAAINDAARPVVAIDLPSGLDCDSGEPLGPTIKAWETVTMVAHKKGFANAESKPYTGKVTVVPIGICRKQQEELLGS